MFDNVDECVKKTTPAANLMIIVTMLVYAALRFWFITNVRDWRDELKTRHQEAQSAIEMSNDRQVAPKQNDVPVGKPVDPSQIKANNMS